MSLLGGSEPEFDPVDAFTPDHLPEPGPFVREHDVLAGARHATVHEHVTDAFEEHDVYDATFGYNLARLSLDPRHPDAGFRYAEAADNGSDDVVLRVEFTPTTAFCPQAEPLAVGALRALRSTSEITHDAVELRIAERADNADQINERLATLSADGP
ncbi:hypothetical protein EXE53_17625 [Halorubrum sp. SD626R]|uniref:hypothetical protein n=1 Tax=Halorubrum TaxID=56688 RepID=UPI0010F4A4E2|nr:MULTISPECIES: hypothetical protein [Halorubrum]TKX79105.1 hypothetical protein EXE53_17625 [Halorubrum sp. SD626R]